MVGPGMKSGLDNGWSVSAHKPVCALLLMLNLSRDTMRVGFLLAAGLALAEAFMPPPSSVRTGKSPSPDSPPYCNYAPWLSVCSLGRAWPKGLRVRAGDRLCRNSTNGVGL